MARYDGMDELLQHVREHLQGVDHPQLQMERPEPALDLPVQTHGDDFVAAVELMTGLAHDAQQLSQVLSLARMHGLNRDQQLELERLLNRVLRELARCEGMLQGAPQPD